MKKSLKEIEPEGEREERERERLITNWVFCSTSHPFNLRIAFLHVFVDHCSVFLEFEHTNQSVWSESLILLNKTISPQVCIWRKWVSPKSFFKDVRELWERKYLPSSFIVRYKNRLSFSIQVCVVYLFDFDFPDLLGYSFCLCFCVPLGRSPGTNHILIATREWFCSLLMKGSLSTLATFVEQKGREWHCIECHLFNRSGLNW